LSKKILHALARVGLCTTHAFSSQYAYIFFGKKKGVGRVKKSLKNVGLKKKRIGLLVQQK